MSFDLARALRQLKPEKVRIRARRPDRELPFVDREELVGPPLLLDTGVYIDLLKAAHSPRVLRLIGTRIVHHSGIALGELTHNFGRLDPADARTPRVLAALQGVVSEIPMHRLSAPDVSAWGVAGILAGMLFRLGDFSKGQELRCLGDALLYAQAAGEGLTILTRNIRDFDLLNQIAPFGRVLFYRPRVSTPP